MQIYNRNVSGVCVLLCEMQKEEYVTVQIKDVEQLAREGAQNVGVRRGERKKRSKH